MTHHFHGMLSTLLSVFYLTKFKRKAMLQYFSFGTTFKQHWEGHYGSRNMPCGDLVIKIMDPVIERKEKAMSQSLLSCHHAHVVIFMHGLRICDNHVTKDFLVRVVVIAQSYQRTFNITIFRFEKRGWIHFLIKKYISFIKMSSI